MKNPQGQTKKPQLVLVWSLLFGVALIAVCSGMQGTLLGLRASLENFGVDAIGLIMSAYYAGFLLGARIVPKWVKQVGHIRVFAALATIASAVILVHSAFVDPLIWFLLRALTGFCLSGLFMVSESWMNTITDNDNRGRLLAAYMFTITLGFIGGQFLINLASPMGFELFIPRLRGAVRRNRAHAAEQYLRPRDRVCRTPGSGQVDSGSLPWGPWVCSCRD